LYEALTGKPPFVDANPVVVMIMQNEDPVAKLPDQIAQTPLGSCVLRALEKVPEARFASATEFLAAINSGGVQIQESSVTEKTDSKPPPRKRGFFRRR
jgi:hypothetical protein